MSLDKGGNKVSLNQVINYILFQSSFPSTLLLKISSENKDENSDW